MNSTVLAKTRRLMFKPQTKYFKCILEMERIFVIEYLSSVKGEHFTVSGMQSKDCIVNKKFRNKTNSNMGTGSSWSWVTRHPNMLWTHGLFSAECRCCFSQFVSFGHNTFPWETDPFLFASFLFLDPVMHRKQLTFTSAQLVIVHLCGILCILWYSWAK